MSSKLMVGFTGTQKGMTAAQTAALTAILALLQLGRSAFEFIHGGCIGADDEAGKTAYRLGWRVTIRPSNIAAQAAPQPLYNTMHAPADPLERFCVIIGEAGILIAAPKQMYECGGATWGEIKLARRLKCKVIILWPNGTIKMEN